MAQTHKNYKVYICTTPQPSPLNQGEYEGLDWVEIGNVGAVGETGMQTNIVSYDELATEVTMKAKGISNAGDPTIECARNPTDVGQIALRAAAATNFIYAIKFEANDAPSVGYTSSVYYNRGLVAGPTRPGGRNEDFQLEVYTLGLVQREIVVNPAALFVPANSVGPSIALVAADTFIANEGSWSNTPTGYAYLWEEDDSGWATIAGQTGKIATYAGANDIRVTVTASNGAGAGTPAVSLAVTPPA